MLTLTLANLTKLYCQKLVREVTGRRKVYLATLDSKPENEQLVYAKVFNGANFAKYAHRDAAGSQLLSNAGIVTPKLVADELLQDATGRVLCYQAIEAQNAEVLYASFRQVANAENHQNRLNLMQQLTSAVALHHKVGLIQTDLYLKNFLVKDAAVYTLDGDGVRRLSKLFKKREALKNLATLFSKMDVLDDDWIDQLYSSYCKVRGIEYSLFDAADIWVWTQKIRRKVANNYADKKVFRNCTDVKIIQTAEQFLAIARNFCQDSTQHFAENLISENVSAKDLDAALNKPENNLKNGNTCTVGFLQIANQQIVVKRYNIKNYWHSVRIALRQSRAAKSWANAHRLNISHIATPKPLALLEERHRIFKRRTYFLSEYCDAPDIAEFFTKSHLQDKTVVATATAELFYKLYLLKISHGDCKASNIKIMALKPILIDLDAMQSHTSGWAFQAKHVRDLKRFMRNWQDDIEITALLKQAFILQYDADDDILELAGFN